MDSVARRLHASEMTLVDLVVRGKEDTDDTASVVERAERRAATAEVELAHLEQELHHLQEETLEVSHEVRMEEARLLSASSLLARLEKRRAEDPAATPASDTLDTYCDSEVRLRGLEDSLLSVDELIADRAKALEKLRDAHCSLTEMTKVTCDNAFEELVQSKKFGESLQRTLSKLGLRRGDVQARHDRLQKRVSCSAESQADLEAEKSLLEETLRRNESLNRVAENELKLYVNELIGEDHSELRFEMLETTMNALKGVSVNIANDFFFIGEVHTEYAPTSTGTHPVHGEAMLIAFSNPINGMESAFSFVRDYVSSAHGKQRGSDRWTLDYSLEPTYDEVENLLTALKQLSICYDMLPQTVRMCLQLSRAIVRNSENLLHLAKICTSKYAEAKETRALRDAELKLEKEERIRKAIAPKLPTPLQSAGPPQRKARVKVSVRPGSAGSFGGLGGGGGSGSGGPAYIFG